MNIQARRNRLLPLRLKTNDRPAFSTILTASIVIVVLVAALSAGLYADIILAPPIDTNTATTSTTPTTTVTSTVTSFNTLTAETCITTITSVTTSTITVTQTTNLTTTSTTTAVVPNPAAVTIDFDAGLQALSLGQSTPFNQTSGGLAASLSSPSDPAAFSVQSSDTTFFRLSEFSGNYLYPNKPFRTYLDIRFSQPLNNITMTFATIEYHGPGNVETPSNVKLTAYMNSTNTTAIGSVITHGTFSSDSYPQGILIFNSDGQPFDLVRIEVLYQPSGASAFLVDNIVVSTAS